MTTGGGAAMGDYVPTSHHSAWHCPYCTPSREADLAHARAQALRDAAETIPEVGDVLRGMAAREVGGGE